jgi:hypothetical protein
MLEVAVTGAASDLFGNAATGARVVLSNEVETCERTTFGGGRFACDVPPGTYSLYATHTSQGVVQSNFSRVVVPSAKSHHVPVELRYSVTLTGAVRQEQRPSSATVRVAAGGAVHQFSAAGPFSVVLPTGDYAVGAESKRQEWGLNVSYSATRSVTLRDHQFVSLELKRADLHSATLTWPASQTQTLRPGEKLSTPYVVTLDNTGNVADTWTLSGTLTEWNISFSASKVSLEPGNGRRKETVYVTLQAPKDAKVAHPEIGIQATSEKGKQTAAATLDVNVVQVYGVGLSKSSAEFTGPEGKIRLRLENTGNGDDNYTASLLNDQELLSAGWRVGFAAGNETSRTTTRGVTASEGGADLTLLVRPAANPKKSVEVLLEARSLKGAAQTRITVPITLPDLTTGEIKIEGPEARSAPFDTLSPWYPVLYVLVIIPISFILIYFFQKHGFRGLAAIIKWRVRRNLLGPRARR